MELIKIAEKIKVAATEGRTLGAMIVLCGLIALIVELRTDKPEAVSANDASTFIPDGFVLVPIDVQNPEALDSILGSYGVVDLFVPASAEGRPSRAIAKRIKILRAPLNPNHFAVLAPEDEAPGLVRETGPFNVVIQNPRQVGTDFVKSRPKRSRIRVENIE